MLGVEHSPGTQDVYSKCLQHQVRSREHSTGLKWFGAPGKACQEEDRGGDGGKVVLSMHTKGYHLNFLCLICMKLLLKNK